MCVCTLCVVLFLPITLSLSSTGVSLSLSLSLLLPRNSTFSHSRVTPDYPENGGEDRTQFSENFSLSSGSFFLFSFSLSLSLSLVLSRGEWVHRTANVEIRAGLENRKTRLTTGVQKGHKMANGLNHFVYKELKKEVNALVLTFLLQNKKTKKWRRCRRRQPGLTVTVRKQMEGPCQ